MNNQETSNYAAPAPVAKSDKSRVTYVLLGIFFGGLGVHNFYAGRTVWAVLQLLFTLIVTPIALILTLITGGIGGILTFPIFALFFLWIILELILVTKDAKGNSFI